MQTRKKWFSLLLVLCMAMSTHWTAVFAAATPTPQLKTWDGKTITGTLSTFNGQWVFIVDNAAAYTTATTWKVYLDSEKTIPAAGVITDYSRNSTEKYMLQIKGLTKTAHYYVAAKNTGSDESTPLMLDIQYTGAAVPPTTPTPQLKKWGGSAITGTLSTYNGQWAFMLDNAAAYTTSTTWAVYADNEKNIPAAGVTATYAYDTDKSADILKLSGLTETAHYYVAAKNTGSNESTPFMLDIQYTGAAVPTSTPAPRLRTWDGKTITEPLSTNNGQWVFMLDNTAAYTTDTTWAVYTDSKKTIPAAGVTAAYVYNTLKRTYTLKIAGLTKTAYYYVTAKNTGLDESAPFTLHIQYTGEAVPPPTPTPQLKKWDGSAIAGTLSTNNGQWAFMLDNAAAYTTATTWTVYTDNGKAIPAAGVTATYAYDGAKGTDILKLAGLTKTSYYYVAAKNTGSSESTPFSLHIQYTGAATTTPTPTPQLKKWDGSAIAGTLSTNNGQWAFMLDNTTDYTTDTTWTVYTDSGKTIPAAGVTATYAYDGAKGTDILKLAGLVKSATYYVAAKNTGLDESTPFMLDIQYTGATTANVVLKYTAEETGIQYSLDSTDGIDGTWNTLTSDVTIPVNMGNLFTIHVKKAGYGVGFKGSLDVGKWSNIILGDAVLTPTIMDMACALSSTSEQVTLTIRNATGENKNTLVIFAVHDDNQTLERISVHPVQCGAGEQTTVVWKESADVTLPTFKVFVLDTNGLRSLLLNKA